MSDALTHISYVDHDEWFAVEWQGEEMVWHIYTDIVKSLRFLKADAAIVHENLNRFYTLEESIVIIKIGLDLIIVGVYDYDDTYKLRLYWRNQLRVAFELDTDQFANLIDAMVADT